MKHDAAKPHGTKTVLRLPTRLGHWLSPDPLGGNVMDPQSLNRYAYALNNPTTNIDPLGLDCQSTTSDFAAPISGAIQVTTTAACPGDGFTIVTLPSEEGVTAPHQIPPGVKPPPVPPLKLITWPQLQALVHENNIARQHNVCDEPIDCFVFRESQL